jgi:hypothetical protein
MIKKIVKMISIEQSQLNYLVDLPILLLNQKQHYIQYHQFQKNIFST